MAPIILCAFACGTPISNAAIERNKNFSRFMMLIILMLILKLYSLIDHAPLLLPPNRSHGIKQPTAVADERKTPLSYKLIFI